MVARERGRTSDEAAKEGALQVKKQERQA